MKTQPTRIASFLICVFLGISVFAQSNLENSKQQLFQMKNSFILVRLKTDSLKIKALEDNGFHKEAEKVKIALYKENRETVLSFAKTFDFCPVYFFYSSASEKIRIGEISGNVFDNNLNIVEEEHIQSRPFFTAEFGKTGNSGIHALILMDHYFVPLKSPFPFFQRQYLFFSLIKQGKGKIAKKLNNRLKDQYEIWNDPKWGFK